jgi:hypothetical protein
MSTFFLRRGAWEDNALAQQAGLAAARRAGDVGGEAHAVCGLALGYARSGRFGDFQQALAYCEQGLAAIREVGDRNDEAAALDSLGYIHGGLGDPGRGS